MASYFFDTSALTKRYIRETGSSWVSAICDDTEVNLVFVSELTEIEMVSAISRRAKGGNLTTESAQTEIRNFDGDRRDQYLAIDVSRKVLLSAAVLLKDTSCAGMTLFNLPPLLSAAESRIF